jgi:DNA-directed RNA polymerase subunit H (RpoH/RPB5)
MNNLSLNNLNKIFNTLLEPEIGMFYMRKYDINNNTIIKVDNKNIKIIDLKNYLNENIKSIMEKISKKHIVFDINNYNIVFTKKITKKILEDITLPNCIFIYFEGKCDNIKDCFLATHLLFNILKHKYVPYIEVIEDTSNIETSKIAKIKVNDPVIKFYGYNKGETCKIIYKSNKINNIDLYFNYRLII